ncbi:uncharacterized protein LOC113217048 [Frankliniella occidentalis]|uniref:Uncharacterized protein LOC113217048 n=1 Tax=Frankliniella occidentalis TaxID=133901 RepID=A0A6J1THC8_FRAOC|nr:uncharacterized protein LOC113217048 [Frankliniella occidentalis]
MDDDILLNMIAVAVHIAVDNNNIDAVVNIPGNYYAELPQRPPSVDIEGWKRLGDPTFKKQFRMDRTLFEVLVVEVGTHMAATNRLIRQGKPIDEALMNTIWTLANPDCFRSTGGTFGVLGGSIHNQYKTMIQVLEELKSKYIRWPSALEQEVIARELYGYPGVIGCIDGSFISTYKPMDEPQRYINRHHEYSVIVHAVCDHNLLFRDIYVGEPGGVGDARTFQRSPLFQTMVTRPELMDDKHLLGDGAYPLLSQVITPYRDLGNLTQRQRHHNYYLSRTRACIERAFALLKGKWRRLKFFPCYRIEYLIDSIVASMVLHNFIILEGRAYEEDDNPIEPNINVPFNDLFEESRRLGILKREYISIELTPDY